MPTHVILCSGISGMSSSTGSYIGVDFSQRICYTLILLMYIYNFLTIKWPLVINNWPLDLTLWKFFCIQHHRVKTH